MDARCQKAYFIGLCPNTDLSRLGPMKAPRLHSWDTSMGGVKGLGTTRWTSCGTDRRTLFDLRHGWSHRPGSEGDWLPWANLSSLQLASPSCKWEWCCLTWPLLTHPGQTAFERHILMHRFSITNCEMLNLYWWITKDVIKMRSPITCMHFKSLFSHGILFNWGLAALQFCVSFCRTTKWISHTYTYLSALLALPPAPLSIPPFLVTTEHRAELAALHRSFPQHSFSLFYTWQYTCVNPNLPVHPTCPPVLMSTCLFSMSVSLFLPCK